MSSRVFPFMALMACAYAYKLEDPCSLPLDRGNCYSYTQQWHYDASRGQCYEFIYSGCSGNENRFDSLEACESRCKTAPTQSLSITEAARGEKSIPAECRVSVALEECYHASRVWYFDQNRRECVWYSNKDSGSTCRHIGTFKSQETCERTCGTFQGLAVCSVPRDAGPCHNFTAFWFYDLAYGGCSRFWYGGCEVCVRAAECC